jgi:hypothetical protein
MEKLKLKKEKKNNSSDRPPRSELRLVNSSKRQAQTLKFVDYSAKLPHAISLLKISKRPPIVLSSLVSLAKLVNV